MAVNIKGDLYSPAPELLACIQAHPGVKLDEVFDVNITKHSGSSSLQSLRIKCFAMGISVYRPYSGVSDGKVIVIEEYCLSCSGGCRWMPAPDDSPGFKLDVLTPETPMVLSCGGCGRALAPVGTGLKLRSTTDAGDLLEDIDEALRPRMESSGFESLTAIVVSNEMARWLTTLVSFMEEFR